MKLFSEILQARISRLKINCKKRANEIDDVARGAHESFRLSIDEAKLIAQLFLSVFTPFNSIRAIRTKPSLLKSRELVNGRSKTEHSASQHRKIFSRFSVGREK